jgi:hypothetical protein
MRKDEYDAIIEQTQNYSDLMDAYVDLFDEYSVVVDKKYYNAQIDAENQIIENLKKESESLTNDLNDAVRSGRIQMYSESWYDLKSTIDDVNKSIVKSTKNIVSLKNELRQIDWDFFDNLIQDGDNFIDEMDFLYDLFDEDKDFYDKSGYFTNKGAAGLTLRAMQYNADLLQAQREAK